MLQGCEPGHVDCKMRNLWEIDVGVWTIVWKPACKPGNCKLLRSHTVHVQNWFCQVSMRFVHVDCGHVVDWSGRFFLSLIASNSPCFRFPTEATTLSSRSWSTISMTSAWDGPTTFRISSPSVLSHAWNSSIYKFPSNSDPLEGNDMSVIERSFQFRFCFDISISYEQQLLWDSVSHKNALIVLGNWINPVGGHENGFRLQGWCCFPGLLQWSLSICNQSIWWHAKGLGCSGYNPYQPGHGGPTTATGAHETHIAWCPSDPRLQPSGSLPVVMLWMCFWFNACDSRMSP